jgi:beta-galactosidase GanA
MSEIWPKLNKMNLNTVLVNINWEQFEPEEDVFDFTYFKPRQKGSNIGISSNNRVFEK